MFIRSDVLTEGDIYTAFSEARHYDAQDIRVAGRIREFRPRKFRYGYQFYAVADAGTRRPATSGRRVNSGNYGAGDAYAATWDAYGYVMARLYALDPAARIGYYRNLAEFCAVTARYIPRGMTAAFRALAKCVTS